MVLEVEQIHLYDRCMCHPSHMHAIFHKEGDEKELQKSLVKSKQQVQKIGSI